MLKKICLFAGLFLVCVGVPLNAFAEDFFEETVVEEEVVPERSADEISAEALDAYDVEGSLFEKITNLEQEKLIMKLEAERIRLDLELDALNQQKMKKQMEMDGSYVFQADQQQEIQEAKAELDAKIESLKRQIAEMDNKSNEQPERVEEKVEKKEATPQIVGKYKLLNVIGVGNQLQATIQDISTGQNKRISVGKQLNGYTVKSISLNDGIVFEKDGESENLNVGK